MNLCKDYKKYPGNLSYHLSAQYFQEPKVLYDTDQLQKKKKVSSELAQDILLSQVITKEWYMQVHATMPKVKTFFSLSLRKTMQAINNKNIDKDTVLVAEMEVIIKKAPRRYQHGNGRR